jgi:exopolysaccharide production protein ExoQ
MPPSIALLLCSLFVLYLLRLDARKNPGMSRAVWVPTIWVMCCACKPLGQLFGFSQSEGAALDVEAGSPVDRGVAIILIAFALIILARRRLSWSKVFKDNSWLFLLFFYLAISILWSEYPIVSFKRWIRAFGSILMALVVLSEPDPGRALASVFRRSAYVLISFSLLLVKYFAYIGHEYGWSGKRTWVGVTSQKNALGRMCLVCGFFLIWELIGRRRGRGMQLSRSQAAANTLVIVCTVVLLVGSSSATSLALMLLAVAVFLGLLLTRERLKWSVSSIELAAFALLCTVGIAYLFLENSLLETATGALGRDATLTGRTDIWRALWPIAMQHPVLGQGYGSFWVRQRWFSLGSEGTFVTVKEGHNGYLDVFLELGIIGLILLIGFFVGFYRQARRGLSENFDWAGFNICFLLVAVLHNLTESSFVQSTTYLWTVMIFLAIVSPLATSPLPPTDLDLTSKTTAFGETRERAALERGLGLQAEGPGQDRAVLCS